MEYPTLTTINGRPTYEGINKIRHQIYANAYSVDSHRGGINDHLGQIMSPSTYMMVSAAPVTIPPTPGQLPPRPGNIFPRQWEDIKAAQQWGLY
jgi:hypothetical protein